MVGLAFLLIFGGLLLIVAGLRGDSPAEVILRLIKRGQELQGATA